MALSPIRTLGFALLWAFWVSAMTEATNQPTEIPSCSGWNVLTGCDSTVSKFLAVMVLGTIPGAPALVNALFAVIGVISRAVGIWAVMELIRGS